MAKKKRTYEKIDGETIKEITQVVVDVLREEESKAVKERHDRKRANMKILLRNYRSLVDHCESAIYEASQADEDEGLSEILEMMGDRSGGFRIESIRESAVRTRLIIDHIKEMIEHYKIFCERSPRSEDMRRFRIIQLMYIGGEYRTPEEIADSENIDRSTVYRDIDAAVERLTALMFGIDGLHLLKH